MRTNTFIHTFLFLGVLLLLNGCVPSPQQPPAAEKLPLTLMFLQLHNTYKQDYITVRLLVRNDSPQEYVLQNWDVVLPGRNTPLYYRPWGSRLEPQDLTLMPPLSEAASEALPLAPGQSMEVAAEYALNIPPGDYEFQAILWEDKRIRTEIRRITVRENPGMVFNLSKAELK